MEALLITEDLKIQTADGQCDAFAAYPEMGEKFPPVILLMDAFGLRPYLEEMATIIAAQGHYVLVPNLFYRIKPAPVFDIDFPLGQESAAEAIKQVRVAIAGYDFAAGTRDIGSFLDFLGTQPAVKAGQVALTGYCMGGGMALRAAAAYPDRIRLATSFHGGNLATDAAQSPSKGFAKIKARVYIAHADNDSSMPPEQRERVSRELSAAGVRFEAELYEGAEHGFSMADLPPYNEEALKRHYRKLFSLLREG